MSTPTDTNAAGRRLGVVLGAVFGLTILDNLAVSTGIGLVMGAGVDLMGRHRRDGR